MPRLDNLRWEKFAELTATGSSRGDAYLGAGYRSKTRKAAQDKGSLLYSKIEVKARVSELESELHDNSMLRAEVDREFVIRGLKENIEKSSQATPVKNRAGEATGTWKYEPAACNRAYELLGKELGMFVERFSVANLDNELDGMSPEQLRNFIGSAAMQAGLRLVDMNAERTKKFILANAERVGLEVCEALRH